MTIKTKGLVLLSIGGLLVALGLIYGFSGMLVPSIQERGGHIARWEKEIVKEGEELEAFIKETDRLGKKTDATPEERQTFEYKMQRLDQMSANLRGTGDRIAYERGRRKEMALITGGFVGVGLLAIVIGVLLRRRRAQ